MFEYFDERLLRKEIRYKTTQLTLPRYPRYDGHKIKRHDLVVALRLPFSQLSLNKIAFMIGKVEIYYFLFRRYKQANLIIHALHSFSFASHYKGGVSVGTKPVSKQ